MLVWLSLGIPVPIYRGSLKLQRPVDEGGREDNLVPEAGERRGHLTSWRICFSNRIKG